MSYLDHIVAADLIEATFPTPDDANATDHRRRITELVDALNLTLDNDDDWGCC